MHSSPSSRWVFAAFLATVALAYTGVVLSIDRPAAFVAPVNAGPATTLLPPSVYAAVPSAESEATVAVAVLDRQTDTYYGSFQDETPFPSESVVKVLIAANLLATGQMTGSIEQDAYRMITASDDDAADALWGDVGGPAVVSWAADRYGINDRGSARTQYGWWGDTKFTAHGLVQFYAAIANDPLVGPWLLDAMSHMSSAADDGTDQRFGLAAQTTDGAFKQGWGGDDDADDSEQLNSTGLLEHDRYAVAVMVQHIPYVPMGQLVPVINAVAAAVVPNGQVVPNASAVTSPAASPAAASSAATSPKTRPAPAPRPAVGHAVILASPPLAARTEPPPQPRGRTALHRAAAAAASAGAEAIGLPRPNNTAAVAVTAASVIAIAVVGWLRERVSRPTTWAKVQGRT